VTPSVEKLYFFALKFGEIGLEISDFGQLVDKFSQRFILRIKEEMPDRRSTAAKRGKQ
jgi:hypothetical protein